MKAIYKRELKSYFHNMTGCVFMAALLLFIGIYFMAINIYQGYPYFATSLSGVAIIMLIAIPILTMRSFAEERKTKTDQLLLTSPVSVGQIVMGKFFAMASVLGITMLVACLAPIVIHFYGGNGFAADYVGILAFFLMGTAYIAVGMFISSLTESQIIAAVGTFCILLVLQLIDGISTILPTSAAGSYIAFFILIAAIAAIIYVMTKNAVISGGIGAAGVIILTIVFFIKKSAFSGLFGTFISSLSLITRYDNIVNQTFDLSTFVYYITFAGVFCFLTAQVIQKRRWS